MLWSSVTQWKRKKQMIFFFLLLFSFWIIIFALDIKRKRIFFSFFLSFILWFYGIRLSSRYWLIPRRYRRVTLYSLGFQPATHINLNKPVLGRRSNLTWRVVHEDSMQNYNKIKVTLPCRTMGAYWPNIRWIDEKCPSGTYTYCTGSSHVEVEICNTLHD